MSAPAPDPQPHPITAQEIDGRIAELESQRDRAQARCALLAGQRALALDLLTRANAEIERLSALIPPAPNSTSGPIGR